MEKSKKKFRLLIIEDEQSVSDALHMILEDEGYEVTTACCASGGFKQHGCGGFDLVITDVNLPDVSGLEVLSRLRASDAPCPVIVITAHYTPEVVESARARGALGVLRKPFLPSDILGLVRLAEQDAAATPCA